MPFFNAVRPDAVRSAPGPLPESNALLISLLGLGSIRAPAEQDGCGLGFRASPASAEIIQRSIEKKFKKAEALLIF